MNFIENFPQGYWEVADKKFINKFEALKTATGLGKPVHFRYFDDVWENFDRSLIGKFTLRELYKQRAQQLRDSYDYLILYFSGGADSYNVLRSFIDNGIHLDEICVKWAKDLIDRDIYKPNTTEESALNYLSEWDYAIAPVLHEVSQKFPNIKIEIVDWFTDKNAIGKENVFEIVNHWHDCEVPSLAVWSPREFEMVEKGKKVAGIYGVDKPQTMFEDNSAYLFFLDSAVTMGTPCPANIYGTEYFYWSPNFPILTFEMANAAITAFRTDQELQEFKFTPTIRSDAREFAFKIGNQQRKLRHVIYETWTDRFQARKPDQLDRSDKHFWLWKYSELEMVKDSYRAMSNAHYDQLASSYLHVDKESGKRLYRPFGTKKHFVCAV
jgi:hypothetical protein